MTEKEFNNLNDFIHTLLYETMTDDDYYYIMSELGVLHRGTRFTTICHSGDGYNLSFDKESKSFFCFSECQCSYSILSLVKKVKGYKTIQALQYICRILNIPFNIKAEVQKSNTNKYNWKGLLKYVNKGKDYVELKHFDKDIIDCFPKIYHQDWLNYGISEETMNMYNIRWYELRQEIVIPVYDEEGNLVGIRVRNMDEENDRKYMPLELLDGTSYKFPTNEIFYGINYNKAEIMKTRTVILVEAEKSVLKARDWLGNKNNTLAIFGSNLGKERVKQLVEMGVETVIIGIDSDFYEVGDEDYVKFEEKIMKMYNMLKPYFKEIYVIYNNLGFKDCYKFSPYDYTREQYEMLMKNKELIVGE